MTPSFAEHTVMAVSYCNCAKHLDLVLQYNVQISSACDFL